MVYNTYINGDSLQKLLDKREISGKKNSGYYC